MTITITAEQRDALYNQVVVRMSGIGDVWLVVETEGFEKAERLGRTYSDELRLIVDDLGWGPKGKGPIELTTPPDMPRRVLSRIRDAVAGQEEQTLREQAEVEARPEECRAANEVCPLVLANLDEEER